MLPTLLELAGVKPLVRAQFDGRSLAGVLRGTSEPPADRTVVVDTLVMFSGDNGTYAVTTEMRDDREVGGGKSNPTDSGSWVPLLVHGDVQLGVPLEGGESVASLARGGDGKVARFDGGHLEIGGPAFDPPGAEFTLLLRVRDLQGEWNAPLFGSYGGDGRASLYLRGVDGATLPREDRNYVGGKMSTPTAWMFGWPEGPRAIKGSRGVIEFLWGAKGLNLTPARVNMLPKNLPPGEIPPLARDANNAVQHLVFPMEPTGPREWHDVVVRATGAKLELWLDGVLLDEEFPIGTTRPVTAPRYFGAALLADGKLLAGFHGLMDHAALWHRALSEAEIVALSGGAKLAQQRELAILGAPPEQMQYFRARGHNSKAGDCFPLFHDGTYHLFPAHAERPTKECRGDGQAGRVGAAGGGLCPQHRHALSPRRALRSL
ncbi:MAG: hypothetical protein NTY19_42250 [Planctomycetota bacterium]|nr:hypothetical protein [Planctomycetota bacterium]